MKSKLGWFVLTLAALHSGSPEPVLSLERADPPEPEPDPVTLAPQLLAPTDPPRPKRDRRADRARQMEHARRAR